MQILIADDHVAIQQRLVKIVSQVRNAQVVGVASDGIEALKLIQDLKPELAILDLRMPGMDGFELIRNVKQNYPSTILLVLTNFATSAHRERCLKLGVKYFFDKTTEFEQAIEMIERLASLCDIRPV
ncbi:MAG: response regulator transcription factor [Bacteroidota bacterium]